MFETATGFSAGGPAWRISGDNQLMTVSNFLSMHNSIPGVDTGGPNQSRQNACYTDGQNTGTGGTGAGVLKHMIEMFDLLHQKNIKTDTFASGNLGGNATNTGRTGNWRLRYGVGSMGVCVVAGDTNGLTTADPSGNNDLGEVLPPFSTYGAGAANVTFVDMKAGSAGAGGGSYALTGAGNAAYGRVPGGRGVLALDLAGNARRGDGSGAAGAYERTIG